MRRTALLLFACAHIGAAADAPFALTPAAGVQGSSIDVVTNASLSQSGTVAFEPAGNIVVSNLRAPNRVLEFTIEISPKATAGAYTFVFTPPAQPDAAAPPEPLRVANAFTVNAAPKPTDRVIGPRVDIVTPSTLRAGQRYLLKLQGKNLGPDTALSFGRNMLIVGAPLFLSPTEATVDVIVSLAAAPGVAAAVATNAAGTNRGPGGVLITNAPDAPIIILDDPREAILASEQTAFSWHESLPGTAAFFLFQLSDEEGKLIFSAQTFKPSFALRSADLDIMDIKSPKRVRWSVAGIANKIETVETSEERPVVLGPRP